jgi:hypothetical protein
MAETAAGHFFSAASIHSVHFEPNSVSMFYANPSLKKAQLRVPQLLQLGQEAGNDLAA